MSYDPIAIAGAVGGFVGVASLAASRWRGDERKDRNDHQACLDKLAEHIEKAEKRSDAHDREIAYLRDEHSSCREHLQVLSLEIKSIRKSISPQPFPKVTT